MDELARDKSAYKHFFKGTSTIYWWDGAVWRIQTKHRETIDTLYNHLYKMKYRPKSKVEQVVFAVNDRKFNKVYKLMEWAYKKIGEMAA